MDDVPDPVDAVLIVLAILSVLTWTIVFVKLSRFWQDERGNRRFLAAFAQASRLQEVGPDGEGACAGLSRAGLEAARALEQAEVAELDAQDRREMLREALRLQMHREQARLESGLGVLASVGSTAPFIGLFGTVWGIMGALKNISHAGSAGLDVVAGPIGEALIATAMGIAVAVPAVLAYNYFLRRLRRAVAAMEHFSAAFVQLFIRSAPGGG